MKKRIDNATKLGQVPEEAQKEHKVFQEWDLVSSRRDHPTILHVHFALFRIMNCYIITRNLIKRTNKRRRGFLMFVVNDIALFLNFTDTY